MNTYTYEEITIGQKVEFAASITAEQMDLFRGITGDENPLHTSAEFAKGKGFSDRVVYGMLTASFLSTLAGMYLPGERSLIQQVEVKNTSPLLLCNAGNLRVRGEVIEKNDTFSRITVKVTIADAAGNKVLRGKMQVLMQK